MMIVFLGPPGAGKGTQAETISKEKKIPHISSGNILREAVEAGTETGVMARSFIENGLLVPDKIVVEIIKERILKNDCRSGFVLDGFPRTLNQAKVLDGMLLNIESCLDVVFYFSVSKESVVQRLSGRLICGVCGANYHKIYVPALKQGICDKCGGTLNQRADDKPETVLERLRVYHEQTEGLIAYYKKSGILREISGDDTQIQMITRKISDIIKGVKQEKSLIGRGVN